jgi:hypothetical protein
MDIFIRNKISQGNEMVANHRLDRSLVAVTGVFVFFHTERLGNITKFVSTDLDEKQQLK